MKKFSMGIFVAFFVLFLANGALWADNFISSTNNNVTGGTVINFEDYSRGTPIGSTQYAGVTFGQTPYDGYPQIDKYGPIVDDKGVEYASGWLYGYGASSGSGVLTGSREGGYASPTIAGLSISFQTPVKEFQTFFSDTAPLGDYLVEAFSSTGSLLEWFTIPRLETLPPSYAGGEFPVWPYSDLSPLPGIYIGFQRQLADIVSIKIAPSGVRYDYDDAGNLVIVTDAFAIDDVQFKTTAVPEPATMLLLGLGLMGLAGIRRRLN